MEQRKTDETRDGKRRRGAHLSRWTRDHTGEQHGNAEEARRGRDALVGQMSRTAAGDPWLTEEEVRAHVRMEEKEKKTQETKRKKEEETGEDRQRDTEHGTPQNKRCRDMEEAQQGRDVLWRRT